MPQRIEPFFWVVARLPFRTRLRVLERAQRMNQSVAAFVQSAVEKALTDGAAPER